MMPALAAEYTASPLEPTRPASELMLTIRPRRRSIMPSSTARVTRIGPFKLIARTLSQVSSALFTNGSALSQPALLTRMSVGPRRRSASAIAAATAPASVTSMRRPMPPTASPASRAVRSSTSSAATFAPSAARRSAIARPMPRPAPVTSATRSVSPRIS